MRNDHDVGGKALIPWGIAAAILVLAASSCTNDASVSSPTSNPTTAATGGRSPVTSPTSSPASEATELGIFAEVGGWIAYENEEGIWAVNPTPGVTPGRIELSERPGEPLAWSSDGSKLLIFVPSGFSYDLLVLNADGTETRLTTPDFCCAPWWASLSPDGSQVVYSDSYGRYRTAIYDVDSAGGKPRLLRATIQSPGGSMLYAPAFSPDGTQIAYFDGGGDWGHNLWVMNADGSGARKLVDSEPISCRHFHRLMWSPDGSRLAFDCQESGSRHRLGRGHGIWVVNADGSGLTDVIPHGANPYWSPNGMRILYQRKNLGAGRGPLEIARWDGTHVQTFGFGGSGPWNPLPLSVQQ